MFKSIGIAVAILVAAACSPSRAAAECGDYVHLSKDASDTGTSTPVGHRPCDDPNCSGKPATPAAPISVPVNDSEGSKEFAARAGGDADPNDTRETFTRQVSLNLPDPILAAIFHPPRIS